MRFRRLAAIIAMCVPLASFSVTGVACVPDDVLKYFSRNACDFLNCDVLFWVEDIFPLSQRPMVGGASASGGAAEASEEEEEGGHIH